VDVLQPSVNVTVEIGERRLEKEFSNVVVVMESGASAEPATATVVVYGPPREIANLKSSDIKLVLPSDGDTTKAKLELPAAIQTKVNLRSVKPAKFKSR
jgi:hypothetical protein